MNDEVKKETIHGLITGRGNGDLGSITVRTDGSILLENMALSNIAIRNCDLHAESGERPIPFADRMNQLEDFAGDGHEAAPDNKLIAGHTHDYRPIYSNETDCAPCGNPRRARIGFLLAMPAVGGEGEGL